MYCCTAVYVYRAMTLCTVVLQYGCAVQYCSLGVQGYVLLYCSLGEQGYELFVLQYGCAVLYCSTAVLYGGTVLGTAVLLYGFTKSCPPPVCVVTVCKERGRERERERGSGHLSVCVFCTFGLFGAGRSVAPLEGSHCE